MTSRRVLAPAVCALMAFIVAGCGGESRSQDSHGKQSTKLVADAPELSPEEVKTLESVAKVDDHPLYVMTFDGDYEIDSTELASRLTTMETSFACSLFAAFDGPDGSLYGRNFDWYDNPALLLFTNPSDGYASVSMVDISYLGYANDQLDQLDSLEGREGLLQAPQIPFDGMNEHGLVVGMAAVPTSDAPFVETRPSVLSVTMIRYMLDGARTVDEALRVFDEYNVDFSTGPCIHYLIADAEGNSALIELKDGKKNVFRNDDPWQVATNFYLTGVAEDPKNQCHRFDALVSVLKRNNGEVSMNEAMDALQEVSQGNTQWSVIYGIDSKTASIVLSKEYDTRYSISLESQEIERAEVVEQ